MDRKVLELLENKGDNYILPFFWQHGEEEIVLREYMEAIHNCGIGAVCVEARPHPDFGGPQWWHDMDIIMEEARSRQMRVWLLDDAHFPTGYANGKLVDADPTLCKQYVMVTQSDVLGAVPSITLDIASMARFVPSPFASAALPSRMRGNVRIFEDDALLCVVASRLVEGNAVDDSLVDLTDKIIDGKLRWDVPDGMWRIYVIYLTRNGGGRTDYIHVIDEASCRVQIDAVYEPHYERYKKDFGSTFAGFFSDEPLFGNTFGFNWDESIGRKRMPLPWNKDVPVMLADALGQDWSRYLPALWTEVGDSNLTARVRYAYMDVITRLVEKNFSNQIGYWCRERGVEYIGHVIEDNNQSSRLGCSLGHYFRSLDGQHMGGIDDIGGQVLPGGEDHTRRVDGDGEFYHFALAKLGSSHGHIDPKKRGRSMCEIFGAYGWSETISTMKWLTDHFVVRGINHFVPHAFSPKEFPDRDCPPHFYAHGKNPQYRHFGYLMQYMNRVCHIFSQGQHVAPVALLYHGEAEWCGKFMFLQKPARELMQSQIDFDILPVDVFADMEKFNASFDGRLHVNGETYQALVIPYSQFITAEMVEFVSKASRVGFEIIFVDALPEGLCEQQDRQFGEPFDVALERCSVVSLDELGSHLTQAGIFDIKLSEPFRRLRYYHYKQEEHIYMFFNEDVTGIFDGWIDVPVIGHAVTYDALDNAIRQVRFEPLEKGTRLHLRLEPYQSAIVLFGEYRDVMPNLRTPAEEKIVLDGSWTFSIASAEEYPHFHNPQRLHKLVNIGDLHPDFSGFMRYEKDLKVEVDRIPVYLEIEKAFDGVEVWINGKYCGMRICPPYRFDLRGNAQPGINTLRIEVANTLDREIRAISGDDPISMHFNGYAPLSPSGLLGDVFLVM